MENMLIKSNSFTEMLSSFRREKSLQPDPNLLKTKFAVKPSMKAVVYDKKEESGMKLLEDVETPSLSPTQVLVKVTAAGLNPVDYKLPGMPFNTIDGSIVGQDFAGEIVKLGWRAGDLVHLVPFSLGDHVFGYSRGALSEYAVCDVDMISIIPDTLDLKQAAALPTVALTGLQMLRNNNFTPGDVVLVIGASGGVGTMAIQEAKLLGASKVFAICSKENCDLVKSLGADEVIAYDESDVAQVMQDLKLVGVEVNIIVDTYSGPEDTHYEAETRSLLKKGGKYVCIHGTTLDWVRKFLSSKINLQRSGFDMVLCKHNRKDLEVIADWANQKLLKAVIDREEPLTEQGVTDAYNHLKSNHTKGKIIVTMCA